MVLVFKYGQIKINIEENGNKTNFMAKVKSSSLMVISTRVNTKRISRMDMEHILVQMVVNIKVFGKIID